jgi:hypothetical protein
VCTPLENLADRLANLFRLLANYTIEKEEEERSNEEGRKCGIVHMERKLKTQNSIKNNWQKKKKTNLSLSSCHFSSFFCHPESQIERDTRKPAEGGHDVCVREMQKREKRNAKKKKTSSRVQKKEDTTHNRHHALLPS